MTSSRCSPSRRKHSSKRNRKFSKTRRHVAVDMAAISAWIFSFKFLIVLGLLEYTLSFKNPHKKKSGGDRSGLRGGHSMLPLFEITLLGNISFTTSMLAFDVWQVAPSCWNQVWELYSCSPARVGLKNSFSIVTYRSINEK